MADEVDQILQTEQALNELLHELNQLKGQIAGFETARSSLDQVRADLTDAASRLAGLAERLDGVTAQIATIGTPEIVARIGAAEEALGTRLGNELDRSRAAATAEVHKMLSEITKWLKAHEEARASDAAMVAARASSARSSAAIAGFLAFLALLASGAALAAILLDWNLPQ